MPTDLLAAAAHRNAIEHLAGPITAGAIDAALQIAATGIVDVEWTTREPLVLVATLSDLAEQTLTVTATAVGSDGQLLAPAVLVPWTPPARPCRYSSLRSIRWRGPTSRSSSSWRSRMRSATRPPKPSRPGRFHS